METAQRSRERQLQLIPRADLIKTSPVDQADWNYRPVLGTIQRLRFHLASALLAGRRYRRLLEVGYGSGIFMPDLSQRCEELYGIDVHPKAREVCSLLGAQGVHAHLEEASATSIPFGPGFFDAIVCVSTVEFIDGPDMACKEMARVLAPGGCAVVVTPGSSKIVDLGLRLLTGQDAEGSFQGRRSSVGSVLQQHFQVVEERSFPSWAWGHGWPRLYTGYLLSR